MTDKAWVQSYPQGVPTEVRLDRYGSVRDIFEEACRKFSAKTAFSNGGVSLTYERIEGLSRDFAAYLQALSRMRKGDRVALMMPNVLQYPIALVAAIRAGFVVVNVNPQSTPSELEYQLRDAGVKAIVVHEEVAHTLSQIIQNTPVEHLVVTSHGDMHGFFRRKVLNFLVRRVKKQVPDFTLARSVGFRQALLEGRQKEFRKASLTQDDLAFLQYTAGITGVAKGVMLTHGNMVANLQQVSAWLSQDLDEGKELVVTALPMHHVVSLTLNVLLFVKAGGHCVLITDPTDTKGFIKTMASIPFTVLTGVNGVLKQLSGDSGLEKVRFARTKFVLSGLEATEPLLVEHWKKMTGTRILNAYGLTEASPVVCVTPLQTESTSSSVGLPLSSTLVSIRDDSLNALPAGQEGELWVKGPQVMRGYWNKPRETDAVLTRDGWLRTGDLGHMDSKGSFYITGRKHLV